MQRAAQLHHIGIVSGLQAESFRPRLDGRSRCRRCLGDFVGKFDLSLEHPDLLLLFFQLWLNRGAVSGLLFLKLAFQRLDLLLLGVESIAQIGELVRAGADRRKTEQRCDTGRENSRARCTARCISL